jgi:hypothetical protein
MRAILLILITIFTLNLNAQDKNCFKTYENNKEGISIKYPETWTNIENNKTIFILIRPIENEEQRFRENVNLVITPANGVKLNKYSEMSLSQMNIFLKEYKKESTVFISLNGKEYAKTTYTHNANGLQLKVAFYQTIYKGKGFNITCSALIDTFNNFAPIFEEMISSFEVK